MSKVILSDPLIMFQMKVSDETRWCSQSGNYTGLAILPTLKMVFRLQFTGWVKELKC